MTKPAILDGKGTRDNPLNLKEMTANLEAIVDWYNESENNTTVVYFGAWGRPESVLMPFGLYEQLEAAADKVSELVSEGS